MKILAENIKHRKNDKKTRTTHSMVVPVPSADTNIVGKTTFYMRGKLKSAKSSKTNTSVSTDNKKNKEPDMEGLVQIYLIIII